MSANTVLGSSCSSPHEDRSDICKLKQEEQTAERLKQIKERIEQENKKGKHSAEGGASLTIAHKHRWQEQILKQ